MVGVVAKSQILTLLNINEMITLAHSFTVYRQVTKLAWMWNNKAY